MGNAAQRGPAAAVGLDLGGTNLKGGLVSPRGEVSGWTVTSPGIEHGPSRIIDEMTALARSLLRTAEQQGTEVCGVGVATPGIIDPEFGGLTGGAENLPGWKNTPFMKTMNRRLGVPVYAHNDVSATVLGELWYGAGAGRKNIIMASFGTGVGGGIVINGELYAGSTGYAGEIGHMVTSVNGRPCACGMRGCWEEYASIRGILRTARELLAAGNGRSPLAGLDSRGELTPAAVFEAAARGDPGAGEIVDAVARDTAIGIGSLINIFNPELFIIGGGIASAGEPYLRAIRKHLTDWTLPDAMERADVVPATLGYQAGVIGAAVLVFRGVNRYPREQVETRSVGV
ncbi:MAG: ROK family protein [Spirochaetota bacterium]